MKLSKRYLLRLIREERAKLFEDSVDSELENLKKNVHDDIEHIKDLKKDEEDDREEEHRAEDHRKDESRRRGRRSRSVGYSQLRRMIREQMAGADLGTDMGLPGEELDVVAEEDPAAAAHMAIAAISDLAAAAGVELDITAGDAGVEDVGEVGLMPVAERALKRRLRRKIKEATRSNRRRRR